MHEIVDTFTISPYLIAYGAAIGHTLLLITYIWYPKGYKEPSNPMWRLLFNFFHDYFLVFYFLVGILFLDSAIFWLSGQWLYADWRFQLPKVILGLIIGPQYLIGSLLVRPRKREVGFAIFYAVLLLSMVHIYFPDSFDLRHKLGPLIGVSLLSPILYALFNYFERGKDKSKSLEDTPHTHLWDISKDFKRVFNIKVTILLWVLALAEAMCTFLGGSLFLL